MVYYADFELFKMLKQVLTDFCKLYFWYNFSFLGYGWLQLFKLIFKRENISNNTV